MQIDLTKERAHFLAQELRIWQFDAKVINETENWASVEITGTDDYEAIASLSFNIGVSYGSKISEIK